MAGKNNVLEFILAFRDQTKVALASAKAGLQTLGKTVDTLAAKTALQSEAAEKAARAQGDFVNSLTAVAAVAYGIFQLTDAYAKYETALRSVGKTTGLQGKELNALGQEFKDMSRDVPVAAKDLLDIASVAGQLGISGSENLKKFTTVISQLGIATNLQGEEGAAALAKILNVTRESPENVDRLGSAITRLGNESAATEDKIAHAATMIAQSTAIFGNTSEDVVVYGTLVAELGLRAETAASAFGRAFAAIDIASKTSGDELKAFVEVTGLAAEEFQKLAQDSPKEAFEAFLSGLNASIKSGKNYLPVLAKLGLEGTEATRVLQSLAAQTDRLGLLQGFAAEEYRHATALIKEAEVAYGTFANRVKTLGNSFNVLAIEIGGVLANVFTPFIIAGKGIIDVFLGLNTALMGIPGVAGAVIVSMVGMLAATRALAVALPFMATQASLAWKALGGPIVWVIAGVTGLIGLVAQLASQFEWLGKLAGDAWQGITDFLGITSQQQRDQEKTKSLMEDYLALLREQNEKQGRAAELAKEAAGQKRLELEAQRNLLVATIATLEAEANRKDPNSKSRRPQVARQQLQEKRNELFNFDAQVQYAEGEAKQQQIAKEKEAAREREIQLTEDQVKAHEELAKKLQVELYNQQQQAKAIGLSDIALAAFNTRLQFTLDAQRDNITLSAEELAGIERIVQAESRRLELIERQKIIDKLNAPIKEYVDAAARLDGLFKDGKINSAQRDQIINTTAIVKNLQAAYEFDPASRARAQRETLQLEIDAHVDAFRQAQTAKRISAEEAEAGIERVRAEGQRRLKEGTDYEKSLYQSYLQVISQVPSRERDSEIEAVRLEYAERVKIVEEAVLAGRVSETQGKRDIADLEDELQRKIREGLEYTQKVRENLASLGGAVGYNADLEAFKKAEREKLEFLRVALGEESALYQAAEAQSRRSVEEKEREPVNETLEAVRGPDYQIQLEEESFQRRLELLRAFHAEKGTIETQGARDIEALTRQHENEKLQIQLRGYQVAAESLSGGFGQLADETKKFAGEQSGIYKAMFAVSKAFAIADSIIKITQGVANAAALPFPANLAAMGSVVAATAGLVANIQAVKLARGGHAGDSYSKQVQGFVTGPGGPKDDKIPAWLSNEEFVVNAAATKKHRAILEAMNKNRFSTGGFVVPKAAPRFADGGFVTRSPTRFADGGFVGRTPTPSFPASAGSGGLGSLTINIPIAYHAAPGGQRDGEKDSQQAATQISGEVRRVLVQELRENGLINNAIRKGG